ncbi:hypothetical protein NKDENANG_01828 [Candidatus Entotheonellaceae bacterium PAL068K]
MRPGERRFMRHRKPGKPNRIDGFGTVDLRPCRVPDFDKHGGEKLPGRLSHEWLVGRWHLPMT